MLGGSATWMRLIVELTGSDPIVTDSAVGTVVSDGSTATSSVGATWKSRGQPVVVKLEVLVTCVPTAGVSLAVIVLLWHLLGLLMNGLLCGPAKPYRRTFIVLMRTAMPS